MATIFLTWDASTDPTVNNYRVKIGLTPGGPYTVSIDMGNILDGSISLASGTWYVVVVGVKPDTSETPVSNEIPIVVPALATTSRSFPRPHRIFIGAA
jgi:hypothetical protein